jgi:hypothetical protein
MKNSKPCQICKSCSRSNTYDYTKCTYTARNGTILDSARSGRIGLSKDGRSCKYFSQK